MLNLSILEKKNDSILYEFLPGKPDPTEQCTTGEEKRKRIVQSGSKGAACWYYAFNFLRKRIGKNPPVELMRERFIEAACSERRKALAAYDDIFPFSITELYSKPDSVALKKLDLTNAQLFLESPLYAFSHLCETLDGRSNIIPFIQEFLKEKKHANMHEFLLFKWASKRIELNIKFLNIFSTDVHELIESQAWNEFNIEEKNAALDVYVRDVHADLYKLKRSTWKPQHGINKLIDELLENGPLMILGDFGPTAYTEKPFKMNQKISSRNIYAWRPGAERYESFVRHCVLLVGAKKTQEAAFAYFVDPNDPSDPFDPDQQKIYKISFTNLTSNICSLVGRQEPDSPIGYAYYGNFKV